MRPAAEQLPIIMFLDAGLSEDLRALAEMEVAEMQLRQNLTETLRLVLEGEGDGITDPGILKAEQAVQVLSLSDIFLLIRPK